jgi:ubiquinone/menaquinone biosynthesis C-methylase UbiE
MTYRGTVLSTLYAVGAPGPAGGVGDRQRRLHPEGMAGCFDPVAFRSDRLPIGHFDRRFSEENVAFWVPRLVKAARITPGLDVLDIGCGTGGFARAIARSVPARVTGYDRSERFIAFAKRLPRLPDGSTVRWAVGDAERLSFDASSFDRVLLSLVLHQLAEPRAAVAEAFRVLRGGGLVLVRTIAPEDVAARVPERYLPGMAAADAARLPRIEAVTDWLGQAGFAQVVTERHLRNQPLVLADEERALLVEARSRYGFLTAEEIDEGVRRMRADAARGGWIDPRPTYVIVGARL